MRYRVPVVVNKKVRPEPLPKGAESRIELLRNDPIKEQHLKSAITLLNHRINPMKKKNKYLQHCVYKSEYCDTARRRVDFNVKLKAREPTYLTHELRNALLMRDWKTARNMIQLIIGTGTRLKTITIVKACLVILLNHPSSSAELLDTFLKNASQYDDEEDDAKLILMARTLRPKLLPRLVRTIGQKRQTKRIVDNVAYSEMDLKFPSNSDTKDEVTN